jgi:cytochrome c553
MPNTVAPRFAAFSRFGLFSSFAGFTLCGLVGFVALCAASSSVAAGPAPAHAPPHVATCQACHGTTGRSTAEHIPHLAGQPRAYLSAQLHAFRSGDRKNELMSAIATQLSDAEIAELAMWWSTRDVGAPPTAAAAAPAAAARVATKMSFPATFPDGFVLYERLDHDAGATVELRYANRVAWKAAQAGQALTAGSVILVANHAALVDPATGKPQRDGNGRLVPGPATSFTGMEARAGWGVDIPVLLRNGDWHYALFGADRRVREAINQAECLACHRPQAKDSYVFTMKALGAAAARR